MAIEKRNQLKEIMSLAWSFVRKNGYSMSEALKCAWTNIKLRALLHKKVGVRPAAGAMTYCTYFSPVAWLKELRASP